MQLLLFGPQIAHELVIAAVVDHAIELVAIVRDHADCVDSYVVDPPMPAIEMHQVVNLNRILLLLQLDRRVHLRVVGTVESLTYVLDVECLHLLLDLLDGVVVQLAQIGILNKTAEERDELFALVGI